MENNEVIVFDNYTAYLPGIKAAATFQTNSQDIFLSETDKPIEHDLKDKAKRGIVPWGKDNNMPQLLMQKIGKVPVLSRGMLFNIEMGFGEGILPCYIEYDKDGNKKVLPYKMKYDEVVGNYSPGTADGTRPKDKRIVQDTWNEVNRFFTENDINGWLLEALSDMNFFFNVFPEIGFNLEDHGKRKIVEITHREAIFSRWEEMDPQTGRIEHLFYSTKWAEEGQPHPDKKDIFVLDVVDYRRPVRHLRDVLKKEEKENRKPNQRINRWILPVHFPTPGRTYYQKPYWYSLIESGWYDQAVAIPLAKNAIMEHGMNIRYHIQLAPGYFDEIFKREDITDQEKRKARVKKEYDDINTYMAGKQNRGKNLITIKHRDPNGNEYAAVEIVKVDGAFDKGGEFIADNEEVSNILSYGIGVHPSIIGSSPGKNKTINGTEARELFLIKQIMTKPIRDRLLRPFYVIKEINGWDPDLEFTIPNIQVTTLDKSKNGTETNNE